MILKCCDKYDSFDQGLLKLEGDLEGEINIVIESYKIYTKKFIFYFLFIN